MYVFPLAPLLCNGETPNVAYLIATMPGTCIGVDTSSQSQENAAPFFDILRLQGDAGNVIHGTGYACMLQTMASGWLADFSAQPGTTPTDAAFGVVTLAGKGADAC